MFLVFYVLAFSARKSALALGSDVHSIYLRSTALLIVLWTIYPIVWGLAEGGNVISVDSEMVAYGVLDFLAKPVFTVLHLFSLRKIAYERFGFASGHFSVGHAATGQSEAVERHHEHDKEAQHGDQAGVGTPHGLVANA